MIFLSGKYIVLGSSGMMGSHLLGLLKDKKNISIKAIYFKNVPRIKGTHNAMKTGMLAAEAAFKEININKENPSLLLNE